MEINQTETAILKSIFGDEIALVSENGVTFIQILNALIPGGLDKAPVDILFSPAPWGGYESRLLFSRVVQTTGPRNWNTLNVRIADKNWNAFSWRANAGLPIAQTILLYLEAAK